MFKDFPCSQLLVLQSAASITSPAICLCLHIKKQCQSNTACFFTLVLNLTCIACNMMSRKLQVVAGLQPPGVQKVWEMIQKITVSLIRAFHSVSRDFTIQTTQEKGVWLPLMVVPSESLSSDHNWNRRDMQHVSLNSDDNMVSLFSLATAI